MAVKDDPWPMISIVLFVLHLLSLPIIIYANVTKHHDNVEQEQVSISSLSQNDNQQKEVEKVKVYPKCSYIVVVFIAFISTLISLLSLIFFTVIESQIGQESSIEIVLVSSECIILIIMFHHIHTLTTLAKMVFTRINDKQRGKSCTEMLSLLMTNKKKCPCKYHDRELYYLKFIIVAVCIHLYCDIVTNYAAFASKMNQNISNICLIVI